MFSIGDRVKLSIDLSSLDYEDHFPNVKKSWLNDICEHDGDCGEISSKFQDPYDGTVLYQIWFDDGSMIYQIEQKYLERL